MQTKLNWLQYLEYCYALLKIQTDSISLTLLDVHTTPVHTWFIRLAQSADFVRDTLWKDTMLDDWLRPLIVYISHHYNQSC